LDWAADNAFLIEGILEFEENPEEISE